MSWEKHLETLTAYIDGELTPVERVEFEEILRSSPELQAKLNDHLEIKSLVGDSKMVQPDPNFTEAVMDRIHNQPEQKRTWWKFGSVAAVFIAFMYVSSMISDSNNGAPMASASLAPLPSYTPAFEQGGITDNDVINFALNRRLPIGQDGAMIEILNDARGEALIKLIPTEYGTGQQLKDFKNALNLTDLQERELLSVINDYKNDLSECCIYNADHSVAVSTELWFINQNLMEDLLAVTGNLGATKFASYKADRPEKKRQKKFVVINLDSMTCSPKKLMVAEMERSNEKGIALKACKESNQEICATNVSVKVQCNACPAPVELGGSDYYDLNFAGSNMQPMWSDAQHMISQFYSEMEQLKAIAAKNSKSGYSNIVSVQVKQKGNTVQRTVTVKDGECQTYSSTTTETVSPQSHPHTIVFNKHYQTPGTHNKNLYIELQKEMSWMDSMMQESKEEVITPWQEGNGSKTQQLQTEIYQRNLAKLKREMDSIKAVIEAERSAPMQAPTPKKGATLVND